MIKSPGGAAVGLGVSLPGLEQTNLLSGLHFVTGMKSALLPGQVKYLWLPYSPSEQPFTS